MFNEEPIKVLDKDGKFVDESQDGESIEAVQEPITKDQMYPVDEDTAETIDDHIEEPIPADASEHLEETSLVGDVPVPEITQEVKSSGKASEDAPKKHRPKKTIQTQSWIEVYSSRQNKSMLKWPVTAIEEHSIKGEKILCLVVSKDHLKGIIPFNETGLKPAESHSADRIRLLKYIGQEIAFIVIGIDTENERFIASRKFALARLSARKWPDLKEGSVVHATARRVYDRGVIVEFDGIEARLPIWEITYGWVDEMADHIQPGDELDVKIISLDRENERVSVSLKALVPNPWPGALDQYQKGGMYLGKVTGVVNFGVFVELEPGVNALCNHLRTTSKFQAELYDQVAVQVTDVSFNNGEGKVKGGVIRIVRKAS